MKMQKSLVMIGAMLCAGAVVPAVTADEPARSAGSTGNIQSMTDRLQDRISSFDRRGDFRREARGRWSSFDLRERRSVRLQFSLPSSGEYRNVMRIMRVRAARSGLRERGARYHDP